MKQMEREKKMREMQKKEIGNGDTTEVKVSKCLIGMSLW